MLSCLCFEPVQFTNNTEDDHHIVYQKESGFQSIIYTKSTFSYDNDTVHAHDMRTKLIDFFS